MCYNADEPWKYKKLRKPVTKDHISDEPLYMTCADRQSNETKSRERGWLQLGMQKERGATANRYWVASWDDKNVLNCAWWWLYNSELYTSNGWTVWYVNYTSIRLLKIPVEKAGCVAAIYNLCRFLQSINP